MYSRGRDHRSLVDREVGHHGLSELHVVNSMHARKALMSDLSDGFIALPGGLGTADELFEILTWAQLGLHTKPCGLLDVNGYFAHPLQFLEHAVRDGFILAPHRSLLRTSSEPAERLDAFDVY